MSEKKDIERTAERAKFRAVINAKAGRKLRSQKSPNQGVWIGLGMMGIIGWSVAVPTVTGVGLGLWLDRRYPMAHSWVLTLMVLGLFCGIFIAWYWVLKEDREIQEEEEYGENNGDRD